MENRKYLLVIKRNNKDYLPLEWNLTSYYGGENLNTIEGIDQFTSKMTQGELIADIINNNIVSGKERFIKFAIIYSENGRIRELREEVIFQDKVAICNDLATIKFLVSNYRNKEMLNNIITKFNLENESPELQQFILLIKNIKNMPINNIQEVIAKFETFLNLSYNDKRKVNVVISRQNIVKEDKDIKRREKVA